MDGREYHQQVNDYLERLHQVAMVKMEQDFRSNPPLDKNGKPTSILAYRVIDRFFEKRNEALDLQHEACINSMRPDILKIMFDQLSDLGIIYQTTEGKYRYNLNYENVEYQAKVESWLLSMQDRTASIIDYGDIRVPGNFYDCLPFYPGGELEHKIFHSC